GGLAGSSTLGAGKQPSGNGGSGSPSGKPESIQPSHSCRMPRISRAASISCRRISVMFSSTSGRSIFGFRIEPRSPPVHVATRTSTPSATYRAVDAAPLLDSSSGWACTCNNRRSPLTRHNGPPTPAHLADDCEGDCSGRPHQVHRGELPAAGQGRGLLDRRRNHPHRPRRLSPPPVPPRHHHHPARRYFGGPRRLHDAGESPPPLMDDN